MVILLAFGFLFFMWFVDTMLIQYERTAVQSALLDGARQATRTPTFDPRECKDTIESTLEGTAGGVLQDGQIEEVTCEFDVSTRRVTASARINLKTMFPGSEATAPFPTRDTLRVTLQRRAPGDA